MNYLFLLLAYHSVWLLVACPHAGQAWTATTTTRNLWETQQSTQPSPLLSRFSFQRAAVTIPTTPVDGLSNDDTTGSHPKWNVTTSTQSDAAISEEATIQRSGIAIVMNTNARSVSPQVVQAVERALSNVTQNVTSRLYVTSTAEQAQTAIRELAQDPPALLVPVGGDGTLTTLIQYWHDATKSEPLPPVAYIPMGTGNALEVVVGCHRPRKGPFPRLRSLLSSRRRKSQCLTQTVSDLMEICQGTDSQMDIVDVPLLQITSTPSVFVGGVKPNTTSAVCFFAGVGWDSMMLQDYKDLQAWTRKPHRWNRMWKNSLSSVFGYFVTMLTRTLPRVLAQKNRQHLLQVRVSTKDSKSTVWVDHRRGDVARSLEDPTFSTIIPQDKITPATTTATTGSTASNQEEEVVIYNGPAGIVAAGTVPFYGGGFKLFPFARMSSTSAMHLRVGRIHPLRGMANMGGILSGSYRDDRPGSFGSLDFLSTHFTLQVLDPTQGYPIQHSGESMGVGAKVNFQVLPDPVRFITLLPPRPVFHDDDSLLVPTR